MTSYLESLPAELVDDILDHVFPDEKTLNIKELTSPTCGRFPYASLASLNCSSRTLHFYVEPVLYSTELSRTVAMHRGCQSGNISTIQRASGYGASIQAAANSESTLKLAIQAGQFEAARFLLDRGVTFMNVPSFLRPKWKLLFRPWNEEFLTRYLHERISDPSKGQEALSQRLCDIPLVRIAGWASPDVVRLLLDHGARPNQIYQQSRMVCMSPLSAAIIGRRPDNFTLLLSRGAHINGQDIGRNIKETKPMHIPILAAAAHLDSDDLGRTMMQMCLDHGADITRSCHAGGQMGIRAPRWRRNSSWWLNCRPPNCTTVLPTYLDSIGSWDSFSHSTRPRPAETVKYLLEIGAPYMNAPPRSTRPWRQGNPISRVEGLQRRIWDGFSSSTIEALLDRWGLAQLSNPEFLEVLAILIGHGVARTSISKLLIKYEGSGAELVDGWKRLLDLLIADMVGNNIDLDKVLGRVIAGKGILIKEWPHDEWRGRGEVGRATIDALIAAGADINADVAWDDGDDDGEYVGRANYSSVGEGCAALVLSNSHLYECHDHPDGRPCRAFLPVEAVYREWFSFLASRGADPDLPGRAPPQKSAIDILEERVRLGEVKKDGPLENHLMRLISVLRGDVSTPKYDGERKLPTAG